MRHSLSRREPVSGDGALLVPSLAQHLRQATGAAHRALESRVDRIGASWSPERYRIFLSMSLAVVAPLDGPITAMLGPLFAAPGQTSRAARLRADIVALGGEVAAAPAVAVPRIREMADAFGAAYVLQGSLLGGAVISRRVREQMVAVPASYLGLYGADLGPAWTRFVAALDAFGAGASIDDRRRATAVALATFAAFDAALDVLD